MKWISLAVVALVSCGCGVMKAIDQKEPPPLPFIGTRWQVLLELPQPGEQPWVRFGDGRMEGFGGCSRFSAPIIQDAVGAKAIAVMRIERTPQQVCEARIVAAERRVIDVLQSVSSYSITVDAMTMSGSGGSLKFRAVSEEARR